MSGVHPFQFDPTYPQGEEPVDLEEERDEGDGELTRFDVRVGNTEWCISGGHCVPMSTAEGWFCCQKLEALNQKFNETGVKCTTDHVKFKIVCQLDADVLTTDLDSMYNTLCNPLPEPTENR